jgi:hypothetical protein
MFISDRVETTGKMGGDKFRKREIHIFAFPMHGVGKSNLKPREAVQGCRVASRRKYVVSNRRERALLPACMYCVLTFYW